MDDRYSVETRRVDCCVASCMAFTGEHSQRTDCQHCPGGGCDSARKAGHGDNSLTSRSSHASSANMRTRTEPGSLGRTDNHYMSPQASCEMFSMASFTDNFREELGMFRSAQDVALQLSLDGFQLVNMKTHETTPVIIFNLNLPPAIRYRQENILTSFIIPGPRKHRDLDSSLLPLVEELEGLDHEHTITTASSYMLGFFL